MILIYGKFIINLIIHREKQCGNEDYGLLGLPQTMGTKSPYTIIINENKMLKIRKTSTLGKTKKTSISKNVKKNEQKEKTGNSQPNNLAEMSGLKLRDSVDNMAS